MAAKGKAKKVSRVTKTSRGFSIRTYETPPADFNPLKATPRQLLRHGFPTRPDAKEAPELRKVWDREMSRPRQWITPEFKEMKDRSHGPALKPGSGKRARVRASLNVANATSSNWSGSVAGPPANRTFGWIEGQWTVPNPHAPATGSYFASEWVGIDGWGSGDVLQAGTETEIVDIGFFKVSQVYPWWEWFPSGEVAITNLPVSARRCDVLPDLREFRNNGHGVLDKPEQPCDHYFQHYGAEGHDTGGKLRRMGRGTPHH